MLKGFQSGGVSLCVEDGQPNDAVWFEQELNRVRKSSQDCLSYTTSDFAKLFWISCDSVQQAPDLRCEFSPNAGTFRLIPFD